MAYQTRQREPLLDSDMAQAFGIPVERVYALVFGIGAGLAAIAHKFAPNWAARFLLSVAAGLVIEAWSDIGLGIGVRPAPT